MEKLPTSANSALPAMPIVSAVIGRSLQLPMFIKDYEKTDHPTLPAIS